QFLPKGSKLGRYHRCAASPGWSLFPIFASTGERLNGIQKSQHVVHYKFPAYRISLKVAKQPNVLPFRPPQGLNQTGLASLAHWASVRCRVELLRLEARARHVPGRLYFVTSLPIRFGDPR